MTCLEKVCNSWSKSYPHNILYNQKGYLQVSGKKKERLKVWHKTDFQPFFSIYSYLFTLQVR